MISLTPGNTEVFTPAKDTIVQNTEGIEVEFQTNQQESAWGILQRGAPLEVPAGTTVFFRCNARKVLATIEMG